MREARGGGGKGRILYSIPRFIVIIGAPLFGKMGNFLRFLCYVLGDLSKSKTNAKELILILKLKYIKYSLHLHLLSFSSKC